MGNNTTAKLWSSVWQDGSMEYLKNLPEILTEEKDTVGWMEDYDYPGSSCVYIACVLTAAGNRLEKCPVFPNLIWRNIDKKGSREAERTLSFSEYITQ